MSADVELYMGKVSKHCEKCGKLFSYYNTTYQNRRFCSKICDSIAKRTERIGMTFSEKHKNNISESNMGHPGYWTGKKRSQETIEKFRVSHIGKKQSEETIRKRIKRGAEHYNWQGGITPITRRRVRGIFWKKIADGIRNRDNNTCQDCGFMGENIKLPVHHIIPFRISKNNNEDNLTTLCQSCHVKRDLFWKNCLSELVAKSISAKVI